MGTPNIPKALSEPCAVYKETILIVIAIMFIAAALSFIVMRNNNTKPNKALFIVLLLVAFIAIFSYGVLYFDDSISSFSFLTRSCGTNNTL